MDNISLIIWACTLVLYLVFLAWHENWRGALTEAEITHFMEKLAAQNNLDAQTKQLFQDFMHNDTGREFFMLNLVQFPEGNIKHPDNGADITGRDLLQSYYRPFAGMILKSAGYPAYTGLMRAGYVESWGVEANPGWHATGLMRYRSRRDFMQAVTNPAFSDMHIYKHAALAATLATPLETSQSLLLSPRIWVALLLTLFASLGQIIRLLIYG